MKARLVAGVVLLSIATVALADDWPQFRGPNRDGISKEKGLLKAWPKGGPKLVWTYKDAGLGFSSVAVVKGVVYTLGTDAKFTDEYVIALDEKTGKEKWRAKIAPIYQVIVKGQNVNTYGDGPRSTPTIDGDMLYALSGDGVLVCLDITKQGTEVWRKDLVKDLGGVIMDKYGFSEAPLVDGKQVIVTPGGPNGTLAALDKSNGKVLWRSVQLVQAAPFGSAVVADIHGKRQYIQTSYDKSGDASGSVSGIDAANGNLLWTATFFKGPNDGIGASPIVSGSQVYVSAGFGAGCQLFDIGKNWKATPKYKATSVKLKAKNTHGGLVLIDGHLYGHSEVKTWICQELDTGNLAWSQRLQLSCVSGAVVAAEGLLYFYTDEGEVGLVAADPKAFNLISKFAIPVKSQVPANRQSSRQAKAWAHPVIANGHLYLRDHEYIFAFKIN